MEAVKRRLRRAVCTPTQGGWPTHSWGERATMFTFQVDTEAVGVLGMLQQKPGTAVRLLTCSAGIGGRLLLTCCDRAKRIGLGGINLLNTFNIRHYRVNQPILESV